MMMKKKFIIIGVVLLIVVLLISMYFMLFNQQKEVFIKVAIYPNGPCETYYYTLYDDSILRCLYGDRNNDDIQSDNFIMKTYDKGKKRLNYDEVQTILNLANELEASGYNTPVEFAWDVWYVSIEYNGNVYEMQYSDIGTNDSEIFAELIDKIIELSPVQVHLWGFA